MLVIMGPVLLALAGGHAIADYGLQSAYMAENKVRNGRTPNWFVTLAAHCLIHAFMVLVIAWSTVFGGLLLEGDGPRHAALIASGTATALGWLEFGVHFAIDDAKGQGRFSYRVDQGLHYLCKMVWLVVLAVTIAR